MSRRDRRPPALDAPLSDEPAGDRLDAEIGGVGRARTGGIGLLSRSLARQLARHGPLGVRIRDRRTGRVVGVIECGPDPDLAARALAMVAADLRAKGLAEFVADYGIDPARVPG